MPGTSKPSTVSQLVSCKVSLLGLSVSSKKLGLQGSPGRSPGQDLKMAWCKTYAVTSARQHSPHWLKRYAVRRAGWLPDLLKAVQACLWRATCLMGEEQGPPSCSAGMQAILGPAAVQRPHKCSPTAQPAVGGPPKPACWAARRASAHPTGLPRRQRNMQDDGLAASWGQPAGGLRPCA